MTIISLLLAFYGNPLSGKPPLHDPVTCAHIRQGLSNTFLPAYLSERGTISYLSPTTCLPHGPPCPPIPLWGWRQLSRWLQQHGGSSQRQHW